MANAFEPKPSGVLGTVSFTPAAAAYSAGDIMDVAKAITFAYSDGTPVPLGSLIRVTAASLRIDQTALQASEAAYTLYLYSITPPSAQADNAAWTLASADLPYYRNSISLGTPADLGAACYIKTGGLSEDVQLTTAGLYAELVTVAGFTATAVARQVMLHGLVI